MNDKNQWESSGTYKEPEIKNTHITWVNLGIRIFASFVIYSIFTHIYNPAPLPQGELPIFNEVVITLFTYAIDFFVVFIIFIILFTFFGKVIPKFRLITVTTLLNKALITSLVIDGILIYGGHYAITHA